MDSRQVDDEARIRHKHQALLQEYLVLQKEFISKKRKLQEAKQRKETLLDEVRFLRRRCQLLSKNQSQIVEKGQELVQPQNRDAELKAQAKEGCEVKKSLKRKVVMERVKGGKKTKDLCSDGGKKTKGTGNSVEMSNFHGKIS